MLELKANFKATWLHKMQLGQFFYYYCSIFVVYNSHIHMLGRTPFFSWQHHQIACVPCCWEYLIVIALLDYSIAQTVIDIRRYNINSQF